MTAVDNREFTVSDGVEPRTRSVSFLAFILRFTEPGGVTVPGGPDQPQLLLDRDHRGRPQLPGTSLAGALRAMVAGREMIGARCGQDVAGDWFGPVLSGTEADAKASRVWVYGSEPLDDAGTAVLASTRIDRWRGAAADSTLRTEEVLQAGTRFTVYLRWDDADEREVADLAALIAAWRPLLGRGTSRGHGRCATGDVRHGTLRLSDPDDLLLWLTRHGPDLARAVTAQQVTAQPVAAPDSDGGVPGDMLFRVPVRIAGPWRIGTGDKPERGSREPLRLLRSSPDGPPLVPGTAVKGLLRSRAEFILRSVGVTPVPCRDGQCPDENGAVCWTCHVFGYGGGSDEDATAVGRRAVLRFADSVVADPVPVSRPHIAIDRFTGGVLAGALYATEALEDGTFTIAAELRFSAADEATDNAVGGTRRAEIAAVLRLVLDDLNDGIIGMGAATARGYGSVRVEFGAADGELPSTADARRTLARMVRMSGS
jgi:CRISPR/Cas system CSM-associated protein Csm3 (group 7 of RAMP superfamily)